MTGLEASPCLRSLASLEDYSRTLYGKLSYGNEVPLYVQQGTLLIRLSASSPEGDPTAEAIELMETILYSQPTSPTPS